MALTRRIKKLNKSEVTKVTGRHVLTCKECSIVEMEVAADIGAVTCAYCVQRMVAPPAGISPKEKSDKPRGWHFKTFFEHEGVVYSKGEVVTDAKVIANLKKTSGPVSKDKKKSASVDTTVTKRPRGRPRKHPRPTS